MGGGTRSVLFSSPSVSFAHLALLPATFLSRFSPASGRMGGRGCGGGSRGTARGAVPSPLPPELSLQHLLTSGRLARRLVDVLLIREMPEQSTRCEQHLNAVCSELAGQEVTLVVWGACLFISSLLTDLVPRSRLIEDSSSAEIQFTEEIGLNIWFL